MDAVAGGRDSQWAHFATIKKAIEHLEKQAQKIPRMLQIMKCVRKIQQIFHSFSPTFSQKISEVILYDELALKILSWEQFFYILLTIDL